MLESGSSPSTSSSPSSCASSNGREIMCTLKNSQRRESERADRYTCELKGMNQIRMGGVYLILPLPNFPNTRVNNLACLPEPMYGSVASHSSETFGIHTGTRQRPLAPSCQAPVASCQLEVRAKLQQTTDKGSLQLDPSSGKHPTRFACVTNILIDNHLLRPPRGY